MAVRCEYTVCGLGEGRRLGKGKVGELESRNVRAVLYASMTGLKQHAPIAAVPKFVNLEMSLTTPDVEHMVIGN